MIKRVFQHNRPEAVVKGAGIASHEKNGYEMLELSKARQSELRDAYGSAAKILELLRQLSAFIVRPVVSGDLLLSTTVPPRARSRACISTRSTKETRRQ